MLHDGVHEVRWIDLRRDVERRVEGSDLCGWIAGQRGETLEFLNKHPLSEGVVDLGLFRLDFGLQHVGCIRLAHVGQPARGLGGFAG